VAAPPGLRAPLAPGADPIALPHVAWAKEAAGKEQACQVLAAAMMTVAPYWFEFPTPSEDVKSIFGLNKVHRIVAGTELALA
jgi:hypothetical protein